MKGLVIIDMHLEMQHRIEAGLECVNPKAPARITALAEAFRTKGLAVLHVRHREDVPG